MGELKELLPLGGFQTHFFFQKVLYPYIEIAQVIFSFKISWQNEFKPSLTLVAKQEEDPPGYR